LLLLFSWACVGLGKIMWFLIPASLLAASALSFVWRDKTIVVVLLLNPMAMAFYNGTSDWFDERPAFSGNGLPNHDARNLDRDTRCYYSIGGCKVSGAEWVFHDSHNAGLRFMTIVFGPPPKTYHGAYPLIEEATAAISKAEDTPVAVFLQGKLLMDGRTIDLGQKTAKTILDDFGIYIIDANLLIYRHEIKAAIWKNECLIISARQHYIDDSLHPIENKEGIYLFQLNGLKPIARLIIKGEITPRTPKLLSDY